MTRKLSREIITAAIAGFETQKQHIDFKIAELRNMLNNRLAAAEAPKLKRMVSAASRRRVKPCGALRRVGITDDD